MKHNGYTLTELMITIAIIGILGALIIGAFTPNKAGATEDWSPINTELRSHSIHYMYSSTGYLTIFNDGNGRWGSASDACAELKPLDSNLKRVTLSQGEDTGLTTELFWNSDHTKLTNLDGRNVADCN